MLIDNPQVLVDEGWTLTDKFPEDPNLTAVCTHTHRDHEGFRYQDIIATIQLDDGEFNPIQFPLWKLMKPHQFPESSLSWYLWIWDSNKSCWIAKLHRTRDIINDL
jgi:hypothetical protein